MPLPPLLPTRVREAALPAALHGLTTRGRCFLAAGMACALSAVVLGERDLLRVGIMLLALPLAAAAAVARTRYRLACSRSLDPSRVSAGADGTVVLRLDNVSRLPTSVLLMEDVLPHALGGRPRFVLDRVEAGGVRAVSYPLRTSTRGRYRIGPLSVRLTDPFGFCELTRAFAASDELVVTPAVEALPAARLGGDWTGGGESRARSVSSTGEDDAATREYRQGDDLRRVHWRSTARTGELMVRREEQPWQSRATLLLDTRADAHRGEGAASSFEWAVSATASVAAHLARQGYQLRLVLDDGRVGVPAGGALAEALLLDQLADVGAGGGADLSAATSRLLQGRPGLVVAVLGALDLAAAQSLARVRPAAVRALALLVDPGDWGAVGPRSRAESDERLAAVQARLTVAGWSVAVVPRGGSVAAAWAEVTSGLPAAAGDGLSPAPGTPAGRSDPVAAWHSAPVGVVDVTGDNRHTTSAPPRPVAVGAGTWTTP